MTAKRKRHSSTNATYAAEAVVWAKVRGRAAEQLSISDIRALADRHGCDDPVILRAPSGAHPRGGRYYPAHDGYPPHIRLGRSAPVWLVLHELAHHLAYIGEPQDRGHGRRFRDAYVSLVRVELGDRWADRLSRRFVEFCADPMRVAP